MLTAQPCPRQIHPKSSLPYENTRLNHREGMKLHVFVRRDFWGSVLAPWLRHPALAPCLGQPALAYLAPALACLPKLAASQLAATTSLSAL